MAIRRHLLRVPPAPAHLHHSRHLTHRARAGERFRANHRRGLQIPLAAAWAPIRASPLGRSSVVRHASGLSQVREWGSG